jgi:hypothetical protein
MTDASKQTESELKTPTKKKVTRFADTAPIDPEGTFKQGDAAYELQQGRQNPLWFVMTYGGDTIVDNSPYPKPDAEMLAVHVDSFEPSWREIPDDELYLTLPLRKKPLMEERASLFLQDQAKKLLEEMTKPEAQQLFKYLLQPLGRQDALKTVVLTWESVEPIIWLHLQLKRLKYKDTHCGDLRTIFMQALYIGMDWKEDPQSKPLTTGQAWLYAIQTVNGATRHVREMKIWCSPVPNSTASASTAAPTPAPAPTAGTAAVPSDAATPAASKISDKSQ